MIEPDQELQKVLRQWEPPSPSPQLDARVLSAFRHSAVPRRTHWARKWLPIAAGVLLVAGSVTWLHRGPAMAAKHRGISLVTTADASGFMPVSNGTITVVKGEGRQ